MNELIPKLPQDLRGVLEQYYSAPAPRPEFVSRLEGQLRQNVEQRRSGQDVRERMSFVMLLRTRPFAAILLALLILLVLSGVAYALSRSLGYIPGIGVVDQSAPLRALAEPVTLARAGITLTVEQVVVSAEQTILTYRVEGIPAEAYADDEEGETPPSQVQAIVVTAEGTPEDDQSIAGDENRCHQDGHLLLPDGSLLLSHEGQGNGWITGFENRLVFDAIPTTIDRVIFVVPCIYSTKPGVLPGDWEVPLQLGPAPDLNIFPVTSVASSGPTEDRPQAAMVLEQVIETDDGYILIGRFRSVGLPENAKAMHLSRFIRFTNANGREVEALTYNNIAPANIYGEFPWGYEIKGKQHAWPLTLTIDAINIEFIESTTEFEFDTGSDPQVGQKWILNREMLLEGYTVRVVSIERTANGYAFVFKTDPEVTSVTPNIKDFPFSSASGGDDGLGQGNIFFNIEYDREPPSGMLTIELGWLHANLRGPWQIQWRSENTSPTP